MDVRRVSKRLAYVLRHRPDSVGVTLDAAGWVPVDDLLSGLVAAGLPLTRDQLDDVVARNDKQRFTFDDTRTRIRASQGHSVPVALGYAPLKPPAVLYHGTPTRNVAAILCRGQGLRPGARHAVHLSPDVETAAAVGSRRGAHVVLSVDAAAMAAQGSVFHRSSNGVWLVDAVPARHLSVVGRASPRRPEGPRP